ncbi:endonuclease [Candidatus Roizmanbacteria bacterium RIFCSPHIGHO2_02_FULL_37_13b]|uniref:Endonuclease n=1 Tax=Candidatus Roizmanbacteria bacterium RIFCSPLOWO2_02_FULL_36_11 TaxID=1802071 RepID=A0A1F7JGM5_9BACT|nr:MAG: endonuclease [Candidatus Roizmanbacteria bacterium RIFCSPHIGHO2_02_FULL_37_13b]OGK54771.1 MAG: endonuclease [Candidatus Roizmanbacteria bacterium RIFCSPLOWO2_02_FULL_36_11]
MYWIYAIRSYKDGRIYVGLSANVDKRIKEHNSKQVFSTKGYCPWRLIFKEFVGDRKAARRREKYYKSGIGKEYLKQIPL